MKMVFVFLSGVAFAIAAIFGGGWLWFQISDWLPYKKPSLQIVNQIERKAEKTEPLLRAIDDEKYLDVSKYNRWYVEGIDDNGKRVIFGTWQTASKDLPAGIELGHRLFPPGFIYMLDAGCSIVTLTYDIESAALQKFWCTGSA